jgi:cytochrome c553
MKPGSWTAGLAACTAVLAFAVFSSHASGQEKPRKPSAAASGKAGAAAGGTAAAAKAAPPPTDYAQRFSTVCAACHGANGRSEMVGTPVLAGQPSLYAITQLYLFREGRRNNEAMTAVAKTMTDDDMRGFSEYIGTLPPAAAPAPATPPDAARMAKGKALADQHRCSSCHGADLSGGQQVPRIGGQKEDYLQASLRGFKTGTRAAYTQAMVSAVSQVPPEDLETLAYYAARITPAAAPAGK